MSDRPAKKSQQSINRPETKQARQERPPEGLPQPQSYYHDKYKNIAEADSFHFRNVMEQYSYLQGFSAPIIFEGESAFNLEDSSTEQEAFPFKSLKDQISQQKTENATEILSILKGIDPNAAELYSLIIQFVDSINEVRWIRAGNSKYVNAQSMGGKLKLINQVIDLALSGFSFNPDDNGILRQVIDYLNSPTRLFNIFDEHDQKRISEFFLKKALVGEDFHYLLKEYFRKIGFNARMEENETCFYTAIIYDDEVRALWDEPGVGAKEETKIENEPKSVSAKITTAFNDAANQKIDLLGVNREIEVFARLLAQKDLNPPLAIALFGNWGSGKSFFMHNLEANIKQLSASDIKKSDGTPFYCKEIVHISFNAWSYLDANLWAGLVTSIFEKLSEYLTENTKSGVARMKVLEKLRERLKSFQNLKQTEEEKKVELEILKRGYEFEQKNLKESIKSNFSKKIIQLIDGEKELNDIYSGISEDGYLSELTEQLKFDKLQQEAQPFKSFWRNLKKSSSLFKYVLPALLGIAIVIGIWALGLLLEWGWTGLIPFFTSLGIDWSKLWSRYKQVKKFVLKFNDIVRKNVELEEKVKEHKSLVKNADDQIKEAQVQITQLDEKIKDYEKYMETEINQETIKDFIQKRAEHSDYIGKLGIVSIIRRDFETLSELFTETNRQNIKSGVSEEERELLRGQFKQGRSLERIILYIDDLDRCSDDKVLEVLQAVHLLMAFPLFIVVVGVDKRCVTNALYNREVSKYFQLEEYSEIKKGEKTSGIHIIHPDEYLEKIFQIPFQLQRPTSENIQHMIHELLEKDMLEKSQAETNIDEPSITNIPLPVPRDATDNAPIPEPNLPNQDIPPGNADGKINNEKGQIPEKPSEPEIKQEVPPEGLKITETEREYIKKISPLIGTTPRTIKRFINIYRLIRAHQDLAGINEEREFLIVIFILTMHLGIYKEKADALFHTIREHQNSSLDDILKFFPDKETQNVSLTLRDDKLKDLLAVKVIDIQKYLSFTRRFSFNALDE